MTTFERLALADLDALTIAAGGTPSSANSGGTSTAVAPTKVSTPALVASKILKASAGTLIHLVASNTKASAQMIQIFDSATLPLDNAVPLVSFKVPAADARSYDIPITGMPFSNGIVVCNSSTAATKTIGSADCLFLAVVR